MPNLKLSTIEQMFFTDLFCDLSQINTPALFLRSVAILRATYEKFTLSKGYDYLHYKAFTPTIIFKYVRPRSVVKAVNGNLKFIHLMISIIEASRVA